MVNISTTIEGDSDLGVCNGNIKHIGNQYETNMHKSKCSSIGNVSNMTEKNKETDNDERRTSTSVNTDRHRAKDLWHEGLPVDTGWAWMVLLGCTINMALIFGTLKAFGIYFVEFIVVFEAEVSVTSLISGIQQATYSVFALPMLTFGMKYVTCRQASMTGGFLAGTAYILGSRAVNIYMLLATHGIIYGLALACVFPSSSYLVGLYFNRRRSLANAIVLAGAALGGLGLPPLYRFLLDTYGLRGALIITGGFLFNTMVSAMLMRPTDFYACASRRSNDSGDISESDLSHQAKILEPEQDKLLPSISHNTLHFKPDKLGSSLSHNKLHVCSLSHGKLQDKEKGKLGLSVSKTEVTSLQPSPLLHHIKLNSFVPSNGYVSSTDSIIERLSRSSVIFSASKGDLVHRSVQDLAASNTQISCYKSIDTVNMSVEIENDKPKSLFDFSVLRSSLMRLFLIVYILGGASAGYVHVFIPPYARERQISNYQVALIVSATNACDFIGRVLGGVIVDQHILRSHTTVGITQLLAGVVILMSPIYQQFWSMLIFGILDGLFAGSLFSLAPAVVVDFLGMEKYRSAMGILLVCQGVSLGTSAPIAGLLRDVSGTYTTSFYFIACSALAGAILILIVPVLLRKYKNVWKSHDPKSEKETSVHLTATENSKEDV
ncbi:monocarboxylate transporter 12-B-like [Pecten maximus]|uniref:monocarboxylate transporter 12-B-like n=1 Tax=Pecten maximus TaxID=6579 RepID=UPI001458891C|nr:monocarboxylate transporter 12-B-like [Pecten maximus]